MTEEHDARKWRRVRQRRRIDPADAAVLFDGRPFVETEDRVSGGSELRYLRTGFDRQGRLITVVWTWRPGRRRLITAWKATTDEERRYREEA